MLTNRYVNKPFDETTRQKARQLIEAGGAFDGGFWRNRTKTAAKCGYPSGWESVPDSIKACVNQIGRSASMKAKKKKKPPHEKQPEKPSFSFVVLDTITLEKIWLGTIRVPRNTEKNQIRKIREYVTIRAGFDPKKLLLGIESRMENEEV